MLTDELEFYSFLLECRSFESPGHENGSKATAEPSRQGVVTRLIEEALRGRGLSGFSDTFYSLFPVTDTKSLILYRYAVRKVRERERYLHQFSNYIIDCVLLSDAQHHSTHC